MPIVTTARLILRPFRVEDANPLHKILSETDILRYFPKPEAPSLESVERLIRRQQRHWKEHDYGWWAVALKSDPQREIVGWNGLQYLPFTDEIEIGYLLRKDLWAQGLTTEAAAASLRYGFEQLKIPTIIAVAHLENLSSQRVLLKIGMTLTGQTVYFGMEVNRFILNRPDAHI